MTAITALAKQISMATNTAHIVTVSQNEGERLALRIGGLWVGLTTGRPLPTDDLPCLPDIEPYRTADAAGHTASRWGHGFFFMVLDVGH
jgi:hypothetical protein